MAGIGTVEGETKTAVLREVVWGDVLGKGWRNGAFVRVFYLFEFAESLVSRCLSGLCHFYCHNSPSSES